MSNNSFLDMMLTNKDGYVKAKDLPDIIANIVTAEYIEAVNARFSQAQIDELKAGNLLVTGTIVANAGNIGGAEIVDGNLTITNANVTNELQAGNIETEFLEEAPNGDKFLCHTSIQGNYIRTDYPIYYFVGSRPNRYFLVVSSFKLANTIMYLGFHFTKVIKELEPASPVYNVHLEDNGSTDLKMCAYDVHYLQNKYQCIPNNSLPDNVIETH